jgi:hypothetical protein
LPSKESAVWWKLLSVTEPHLPEPKMPRTRLRQPTIDDAHDSYQRGLTLRFELHEVRLTADGLLIPLTSSVSVDRQIKAFRSLISRYGFQLWGPCYQEGAACAILIPNERLDVEPNVLGEEVDQLIKDRHRRLFEHLHREVAQAKEESRRRPTEKVERDEGTDSTKADSADSATVEVRPQAEVPEPDTDARRPLMELTRNSNYSRLVPPEGIAALELLPTGMTLNNRTPEPVPKTICGLITGSDQEAGCYFVDSKWAVAVSGLVDRDRHGAHASFAVSGEHARLVMQKYQAVAPPVFVQQATL